MKKILYLALALIMAVGLAACGATPTSAPTAAPTSAAAGQTASASDASAAAAATPSPAPLAAATLKMILLGDTPTDVDKVYSQVNEHLQKDLNAKVELEFLSWADMGTKYPLILASGEDYDLINSANWSNYAKYAADGAFWEITQDALTQYAPKTAANTPSEVLDSARVGGKLYNLPMNYKEITIYGYIVRGDLMKKYNVSDIVTLDDFGNYLKAIKTNCPDMVPWDTSGDMTYLRIAHLMSEQEYRDVSTGTGEGPAIAKVENSAKVISFYDIPTLTEFLETMKAWNAAGYWPRSAMANTTPARDSFVNGKSASFVDNLLQASATYTTLKTSHPDWELRFYPITTKPLIANPYINNGMAISAKSKNPERALMFLDLLRNDAWYNQTTTFGIEGVYWQKDGDTKYTSLADSKNFLPDSACPWGWRNSEFYLSPANSFSNYDTVLKAAQSTTINTNINSFTADKTKGDLSSLEATFKNITSQYFTPLSYGFTTDVAADLKTLNDKMKAAGLADYLAECQKQLDAYGVWVK